ncbi:MAG TPA: B-box zinc finger protein [Candidatus Dormibacteraeota bacterium]|jgi:hypothetical protein|nr:B-box zinc finger protein [Candidatus Dormibacteraeota bacterium]
MKCAVHPEVDATGFCRNCGKALCATCARPVREVLYCENCLATGMGMGTPAPPPAANDPYSQPAYQPGFVPPASPLPTPLPPGRPSGAVAFMLGLFPGLGAVYNGEYNKALIHLVIFTALILGLVEAANADDFSVGAVLILAFLLAGFVFYMAFDAMRVSQAKSLGEPVNDPLNDFSKNLPLGPIILIGIGALLLLSNFRVFEFFHLSLGRLWPLILIAAGAVMFRNRTGRS